jgi:GNAT superfamily N-acetyltransferase
MFQKAIMFSVIMINACLYAADMPPIIPFKSERDAIAVARLLELNYSEVVSRADSLKESKRYIGELLKRYAQNEKDERLRFQQFVVLQDEKTVGFVDFTFDPPITRFGVPTGAILALVVDQEYRGRSYGTHLSNRACDVLENRGAHKIRVMTTSEEVWKNFYAHLGFRPSMIGSAGKFDPTFFYHKQIVPPRSWATIASLVLHSIRK